MEEIQMALNHGLGDFQLTEDRIIDEGRTDEKRLAKEYRKRMGIISVSSVLATSYAYDLSQFFTEQSSAGL